MGKFHKISNYRKIYEDHFGKIPDGYHIHHIDGNPLNNDISNLQCLSPEDHKNIHENEFILWASIGGKLGGEKSKNEKLGFCGWTFEERSKANSGRKHTEETKEKQSKILKKLYKDGTMIHWTKKYTKEEVSEKIKNGDPGKSKRNKEGWNKNKKMILKDPEQAKLNKSISALNRQKHECTICGKSFDMGNLTKHRKKCI
jgi:hypothetical protein